jgi:DNA-3-methyladenine glycosylase
VTLRHLLDDAAPLVAQRLLGSTLSVGPCAGRIVEVEAYESDDEASHSRRGRTLRNRSMFEQPGTLYVYRIYGVHWCANIACGPAGHGAAVLIRALEPTGGIEQMRARRNRTDLQELCSGPGKLCQALAIGGTHDGLDVLDTEGAIRLVAGDGAPFDIVTGPRIGITRDADLPWRFGIAGSPHLSKPFPR